MIRRPHFGLLFLLIWPSAVSTSACAEEWKLTIHGGAADRKESIVTFDMPVKAAGLYLLQTENNQTTPIQVAADGRAVFILPAIGKDQTLTGKVIPMLDADKNTGILTEVTNDVLKITAAGLPVLSYQMQAAPVPEGVPPVFSHGAHLHPVYSPGGHIVTGNHAPDHWHHRGVWMAWTKTVFEGREPDFWNMGKDKSGKLTGEVRFGELVKSWSGPVHGGFSSKHRHIDHTSGSEKDVLDEVWDLTAYAPVGAGTSKLSYLFDLVSTQTTAGTEPLKLPKYHYGGLGVRGNAEWDPIDKVTMLTSNGDDRLKGDSTKAKWVYMGGLVDGSPTGMAVLIHPDNFRFPQPLRLNPKNPQHCVAPSQDGDWEITPGKPYVSKYRFVVTDGEADAELLEQLWQDYASPPRAEISQP